MDTRKGFNLCSCQTIPSESKPTNSGITTTEREMPAKEFFKAVVTVPLSSHLPNTPTVSLASVFPKTGLDILINNNSYENIEGLTIAPPIGFIIPPPINQSTNEDEPFQIVPNVEFVGDNVSSNSNSPQLSIKTDVNTVIPSDLGAFNSIYMNGSPMPTCSNQIIPYIQESASFQSGGNIEDLLGDIDSVTSDNDIVKDSIFVCKTRKVIQQLTTVQNSSNTVVNPCRCNCGCNGVSNQTNTVTSPIVSNESINENPCFRTEKSIELTYDYPKPLINSLINTSAPVNEPFSEQEKEIRTNIDSTQTTQTTTEVNSTLMMFERKKIPSKKKSKFPMFHRSNSAPVEIPSDEPIYATVNKLPKKLKRLNIKNLENEIRYVPPERKEEEIIKEVEEPKLVLKDPELKPLGESVHGILKITETETKESEPKTNGTVHKTDSVSESLDKNVNPSVNIIPKSPTVRKKKSKKFSISFKRRSKTRGSFKEQPKEEETETGNNSNKLVLESKSSESDKLLEASSSPDTPDTVKFKEVHPSLCRKHGKAKHSIVSHDSLIHPHHHRHNCYTQANCGAPKFYREDMYPHHVCAMGKRGSERSNDLFSRKASRGYFKQDSFQEMTTSHSERERTNSLSSSGHSGFSLGSGKPRRGSSSRREGNIPWCGCWGNSCI